MLLAASRRYRAFHYFLHEPVILPAILDSGLMPLSEQRGAQRWERMEHVRPGLFEWHYREFTDGLTDQPYINSGLFFTPIGRVPALDPPTA